ncbi:unnamed protein product [Closterium sp. NIES-53]
MQAPLSNPGYETPQNFLSPSPPRVRSGPGSLSVAVALGLSVYLINERLKSITRALIIGFATLVVGWITGSFLVPFIPEGIFPGFWSLELGTSLVTYVFLWFSTTFLK